MDAAIQVHGQAMALGIEYRLDVLALEMLADLVGQSEQMDRATVGDLADEDDAPRGQRHRFERDDIAGGQLGELLLTPVLDRRQPTQAGMHVLGVDRRLQALQFQAQRTHAGKMPFEDA